MEKQINISVKTVLFTALLVLAGYVVYRMGNVIGVLLLSALIVIAMEPLVKKLSRLVLMNRPVPRGLAVVISYLILILVLILIVTIGVPPVIVQIQKLINNLPAISSKLQLGEQFGLTLSDILPQASKLSGGVLSITLAIFSNFTSLVSLLVFSIYLSFDWVNLKKQFLSLLPDNKQDRVEDTLRDIENNVGYWVKGELFLMFIIGVASFIGLEILGVKYALAIAIVSGFLEAVPILGPVISGVFASIIAFADSPIKGLGVIALYIIVQQLENNLLVPKVMQKVSGFSPLVILIALLIGSEFFGLLGAVIAVPVTIIIAVILKRFLSTGSS